VLLRNARRALTGGRRAGAALVGQLERELAACEQVLAQTEPARPKAGLDSTEYPRARGCGRHPRRLGTGQHR